jgi:quinol monooxygenase YgiN
MVIVYGGVAIDPAKVAEVTEAAVPFQSTCRAEEGCVDYTLSWEVAEPNRIRLVEVWESEATYDQHVTQEHVKEWTAFVGAATIDAPAFFRNDIPA